MTTQVASQAASHARLLATRLGKSALRSAVAMIMARMAGCGPKLAMIMLQRWFCLDVKFVGT